jgi:alanyl-tRNA synthetase
MTERLYYTDSYCANFDARIVERIEHEGRTALILDRTHFYPTSGGQPHDTGRIVSEAGTWQVVDVVATDGRVLHIVAEDTVAGSAVGAAVRGEIDWPRRYDHMQQHSGQHLISQTFYKLFGYETVSVHFGDADSTLDLDTPQLEPGQLDEAEAAVNDWIYRNLPITAYFVTDADLPSIPLRRPPAVTGKIRIVEIDGYDYSACGGTHVRTTAEIALVKFLRVERRRGQVRVTFKCGRRAYEDYALKHRWITDVAALYSTDVSQAAELAARTVEQVKELQRSVSELMQRQVTYEAKESVQAAETVGPYRIVVKHLENVPVDAVKSLANAVQAEGKSVALIGADVGGKATVIIARAEDTPLHAGNLLRTVLAEFGGGGGGRPEFAQGGGVSPEHLPALLASAAQRARAELGG